MFATRTFDCSNKRKYPINPNYRPIKKRAFQKIFEIFIGTSFHDLRHWSDYNSL